MRSRDIPRVTYAVAFLLFATGIGHALVSGEAKILLYGPPGTVRAKQTVRGVDFPCVALPQPRIVSVQPNPKCHGYLMVFVGHSGSSVLHEIITRTFNFTSGGFEPLERFKPNATAAVEKASEIFGRAQKRGIRTGFKIRPWSIMKAPELHRRLVEKYKLCVIAQYRLNTLLKSITSIRERESNQTQFTLMDKSIAPNEQYRVTLNDSSSIRDLIDSVQGDGAIDMITGAAATLEPDGTRIIHCTYEEFMQQPQILIDRIAAGLGEETKQAELEKTRFRKASSFLLSQNVDESTFQLLSSAVPDEMLWMLGDQTLCRTGATRRLSDLPRRASCCSRTMA
jgi:hypothetical protein